MADNESTRAAPSSGFGPARGSRIGVTLEPNQHVIDLEPGQTTVVDVTISNHGSFADTLTLTIDGMPRGWATVAQPTLSIDAGQQLVVPVVITIPSGFEGHVRFVVTAR